VIASSIDDKVAVIVKKSREGPVLLYGNEELFEAVKAEGSLVPIRISVDNIPEASFL
jgi:hypothetical protein